MKFRGGCCTTEARWWRASRRRIINCRSNVPRDHDVKAPLISQLVRWREAMLVSQRRFARMEVLPRWPESVDVVSALREYDWIPLDFRPVFIPYRTSRAFPTYVHYMLFVNASRCYLALGIVRWFDVSAFCTRCSRFFFLFTSFYYCDAFTKGAWKLVSHPTLWMGVYWRFQQTGDRYKPG